MLDAPFMGPDIVEELKVLIDMTGNFGLDGRVIREAMASIFEKFKKHPIINDISFN
jgi:hypothetical protein